MLACYSNNLITFDVENNDINCTFHVLFSLLDFKYFFFNDEGNNFRNSYLQLSDKLKSVY